MLYFEFKASTVWLRPGVLELPEDVIRASPSLNEEDEFKRFRGATVPKTGSRESDNQCSAYWDHLRDRMDIYVYTHIYIYICRYVYTDICSHVYTYVYTHTYVRLRICMCSHL